MARVPGHNRVRISELVDFVTQLNALNARWRKVEQDSAHSFGCGLEFSKDNFADQHSELPALDSADEAL